MAPVRRVPLFRALPWLCGLVLACGERPAARPAAHEPAATDPTPAGAESVVSAATAPALTAAALLALTEPSATAWGEPPVPPPPCIELMDAPVPDVRPQSLYSIHGYIGRTLRVHRDDSEREHCIVVAWPPGSVNNDGKPSSVARRIDEAWFRAIENTLARIPFSHIETIYRVVIDNQPRLHGLAAFDREDPDDGRDGHTIWLNEHLFVGDDHWVRANAGSYFSYHTDQPGARIDGLPAEHERFSPVLLHEIGHLVMYNLVNPQDDANSTPECARTCGDEDKGCTGRSKAEREANCISPYCRPFGFTGSTENWAELYRLYYQSTVTRALLSTAGSTCVELLESRDTWGSRDASEWPFGLPNPEGYSKSRWESCGERACKAW